MAADRSGGAVHHPRVRSRPLLLVTALYAVAAFVATLPAVLDFRSAFLSTGLPGYGEAATGDHLQTTYRFWLVGHQLEQGGLPWRDPYSYQPLVDPQSVLGGWPYGFLFWPLDAAFGPVVAWNLLLLGTIVAAGVLTFLWLRELELPPAAALLGGLAFAVAPYRLVQSGGHLLGWAAVLIPLALWAFERSRRAPPGARMHAWGALAAAAVVSIPLSGQLHLALGAIPFFAVYVALRFRRVAAVWAWAGCLAGIGVGLAAEAFLISDSSASEGRSLEEVAQYSASLVDLVSRWRLHGLERYVYLGWLTVALAVAGLVVLARSRRGLAVLFGLVALIPALLALGTHLPFYEGLRDVFPPLRYPRVPGRFLPLADLALAALAAVACAALLARVRTTRRLAIAALLVALVAADLLVFPLRSSVADPDNRAYAALDEAGPGRVLGLPVFERGTGQFNSVYLYYTLQAARERPTGYSLAPDAAFRFTERFNRLDCGAWLPGDREELERLGIRFFALHDGLYRQARVPGAWHARRGLEEAGFRPLERGGVITLFGQGEAAAAAAAAGEPDRSEPLLCDGWNGRELEGSEAALWVYGSGTLTLRLQPRQPGEVVVFADGERVASREVSGPLSLRIPLTGEDWHALVVRGPSGLRLDEALLSTG
jgi:hypothetical protein